jgi:HSP20 family protein
MSSRSNPFDEIERLFDRMSRQFDDASRAWESSAPFGLAGDGEPVPVDLVEEDERFVATADLPGFERDDVTISVTDHTLRIEADHEEAAEESDGEYVRRERRHRSARRSIRLPEAVDTEAVAARMRNGVLTITLPKTEVERARTIEIE